jgi:hypothetical protein
MWTIVIIFLSLVLALFLYIKVVIYFFHKKYEIKYKDIFAAHKLIGYPNLTDIQQFEILDNENTSYLSTLTQFKFIPTGLLDHYINIAPDNYYQHLATKDLQNKMRFDPQNLTDGFFINKNDKGFEYIFVDRRHIEFRKSFRTYDKLLKYLVYSKLKLYAPIKYRQLSKKYYA